jgi:hypothetical protein
VEQSPHVLTLASNVDRDAVTVEIAVNDKDWAIVVDETDDCSKPLMVELYPPGYSGGRYWRFPLDKTIHALLVARWRLCRAGEPEPVFPPPTAVPESAATDQPA